jgi:hypothetical protein
MARNGRTDLLIRLQAAGVAFHTKACVQHLAGTRLEFTVHGAPQSVEAVLVIAAIGPVHPGRRCQTVPVMFCPCSAMPR